MRVSLETAIETLAGEVRERLDPGLESTLFRVAPEAIANAVEHGGAGAVELRLERRRSMLCLIVTDDGRGFEPGADTGGLGLRGVRERIALLGGLLEVRSAPGTGTSVQEQVPLGE